MHARRHLARLLMGPLEHAAQLPPVRISSRHIFVTIIRIRMGTGTSAVMGLSARMCVGVILSVRLCLAVNVGLGMEIRGLRMDRRGDT